MSPRVHSRYAEQCTSSRSATFRGSKISGTCWPHWELSSLSIPARENWAGIIRDSVILQGWPSKIRDCDPVLRPFFQLRGEWTVQGISSSADDWPVGSQDPQKDVYVPCSQESHWSGELPLPASHVYVCMCCCREWALKWRISLVSVMFAWGVLIHKFRSL